MIEVIMTGMCEGCKYADLKLDYYQSYVDEKYWSASCSHANACNSMENKTIDRLAKEWVKEEFSKKGQKDNK